MSNKDSETNQTAKSPANIIEDAKEILRQEKISDAASDLLEALKEITDQAIFIHGHENGEWFLLIQKAAAAITKATTI